MATIVRKGAPSRSYPSRQRKLGPAPFASFEDLSDEMDTENGGADHGESNKVKPMPEIKEDGARSPTEESKRLPECSSMVGAVSNPLFGVPSSMPTSGLQTPSTPRIDISCASSSTPPSDDSNSEKELFKGGLGFAFHEEGTEELRSSTEELDLGEDDLEDESSKKKQEKKDAHEELMRRSSHPANIFARKASTITMALEEDQCNRKPSAHSLYLDGYLSRPTRHSSFGSGDYTRPGAFSSLSAHSTASGRRSASPHKMLLETSFCGSKPIPTKSIDLDSPPKDTLDNSANKSGKISSDSSFEGQKAQTTATTLTTVQVHHTGTPIAVPDQKPVNLSSGGGSHYSPGSPKSSDHWRPISPKTPKADNPEIISNKFDYPGPSGISGVGGGVGGITISGSGCVPVHEAKWERGSIANQVKEVIYQEYHQEQPTCSNTSSGRSSQQFQQSLENVKKKEAPPTRPTQMTKTALTSTSTNSDLEESEVFVAVKTTQNKCVQIDKTVIPNLPTKVPDKTRELFSEDDERTTELNISEDPVVTVEDVPMETKGIFMQESPEDDGDLPYVPTTLPLEKSVVVPIIRSKERRKLSSMAMTTPLQRPRCVRPPNPASINDYISTIPPRTKKAAEAKMKINLPREDSIPDSVPNRPKSPKKKFSTSWTDFALDGLRSPREIRRRMREENGAIDDLSSYHSDSSQDTAGPVNGSDDEADTLLKLPKVPFAMDLDVHSNRSSAVPSPHDEIPVSPPHSTEAPDLPRDKKQFKKPD